MTEVDFYILSEASEERLLRTACRITQKAWSQGLRVYILLASDDEAARMDDMLWTFQQDSFVPHERWHGSSGANAMTNSAGASMTTVWIGSTADLPDLPDLLINLGAPVPEWSARCQRVAELVSADPHRKAEGRLRYRAYREQGVPLRTHEV